MIESDFYQEIKRNFSKSIHFQRIENMVGEGVPDVNAFKIGSGDAWIETKMMRNGRVFIRHSQCRFMWQRCVNHGADNVFVVARGPSEIRIWSGKFVAAACQTAKSKKDPIWRYKENEEGAYIDLGPTTGGPATKKTFALLEHSIFGGAS